MTPAPLIRLKSKAADWKRDIADRLPPRVRRLASRLKRRFISCAVILMYHRIADLQADPQLLAVTTRHFAEHLEVIRSRYRPMRLTELAAALSQGRVPHRAVVLTMDDGYADNLHAARPSLEHYGVPATVFVSSGYVGSGRQFWWDELERMILCPGSLPRRLRYRGADGWREYDVEMVQYGDPDYVAHGAWHVECATDPTARHRLYRRLYNDLYHLSVKERAHALDELRAAIGAPPEADGGGRPLTVGELTELARSSLVDIGAHGVTHAALPQLSVPAQQYEIQESRRQLEQLLDRPVTSFGYPHGGATRVTVHLVQQAGFTCAGASEAETVTRRSDRFRLPRMLVRDWDGDELGRRLHGWLGA